MNSPKATWTPYYPSQDNQLNTTFPSIFLFYDFKIFQVMWNATIHQPPIKASFTTVLEPLKPAIKTSTPATRAESPSDDIEFIKQSSNLYLEPKPWKDPLITPTRLD
ncbi:hypothetical protein Pst134EA_011134 [Puccinia striiformis f. sp. tritici]|uniref:Uncharacterized protein n=3 Tax=Puccinia striiformis TaxID=27350 RepID=A0A2S4V2B9_9BASI|nr:hypothetical protein Pst134EA_011134 [Puccinia striiformis f. sp. tritici]KAH9455884.1 hypothetical protein Pst134EB_012113 [Puccinia striiformis f. sp. tritici]KAH9467491.1 hypothetical protein Pst134EA_011134 [Puccinia striiformis f. sp. tritici]POW03663.1 hypothetical protein PSTT_10916 [Puccinia striiformis]POW11431.1 hypothetical protein PSHT_08389 [Puccinia striiformis]